MDKFYLQTLSNNHLSKPIAEKKGLLSNSPGKVSQLNFAIAWTKETFRVTQSFGTPLEYSSNNGYSNLFGTVIPSSTKPGTHTPTKKTQVAEPLPTAPQHRP